MDGVLRRTLIGKKRGLTWRLQESLEDVEYADDVCFVSHKYEHMYRKLDDLWKESKKAGLEINSSKTEEIRVNTIVNQGLRLNGEDIKRSSDFCYLGSIVAENGGTSREVNARIEPTTTLTIYQKGIHYMGITIFNNLPQSIKAASNNARQFEICLKRFLHTHSFYDMIFYI